MPTAPAATRSPCSSSDDPELGGALAEFRRLRPRLLGVAHRIVGTWAEAEDVVQDVWLRWQTCDRSAVLNPTAFLVTTTTRLAINVATSARARRERSVGVWPSEPVDASDLPAVEAERREALQLGVRVVLQRLAPTERAAYVLRQAFDYPYPRIGPCSRPAKTTPVNSSVALAGTSLLPNVAGRPLLSSNASCTHSAWPHNRVI
jgi:RNA polymerase sigma-70 factor (ECF subfamily)